MLLTNSYAGVGCEMDVICDLARRQSLRVIEDASQAVNAFQCGRPLGSIGDLGTYSFHETKNYVCGEVDKYTWVDIGSSYVPSEILAAFLAAQFEMLDEVAERREAIYTGYYSDLEPLERRGLLRLPRIPESCRSNYHMFYVLLNDSETRDQLIPYLSDRQISAVFHYVPLHASPVGRRVAGGPKPLPVTEDLSAHLLRLTFYYELADEERMRVVSSVSTFLEKYSS